MINIKPKKTLYFKLTVYFSILITLICMLSIGIIYFWSYHYFDNLFEDKVIEIHTSTSNQNVNIRDEWILGVTANSITLVEAIHDTPTAKHISEKAKVQIASSQLYREEIDGKYLMYMIDIDYENGEKVYKYSVIKDIYKEIFPKMLTYFFITMIFVFILSICIIRVICKHLTSDINQISDVADKFAKKDWENPININTSNDDLAQLVNSFDNMRANLVEQDKVQQTMLQYISHELKTPIMIISSYTEAAREDIFPNGDLNSTLDTVLVQTNRIERKVEQLLFIAKLSNNQIVKNKDIVNICSIISRILVNFNAIIESKEDISIVLNINADINILGYEDKLVVAFENIIENQIRYAKKNIIIRCVDNLDTIILLFFNDGEIINSNNHDFIFNPFEKGPKGKHGLGMNIAKRVFEIHNGSISFKPTNYGCLFKIILPK